VATPGVTPHPSIRPYRDSDRPAVYDVCLRTGYRGEDATGKFEDPDLLANIYAGPYLHLEPDLAFVLDDGHGAPVGYVIGTASTDRFVRSYQEQWIPRFATRYPVPTRAPATADEQFVTVFHSPERMLRPELAEYPAHLHIDILPAYQGRGYGRALIETFVEAARGAGAGGIHLVVAVDNTRAHGFYRRVGFEPLPITAEGAVYFGLRIVSGQADQVQ
jgi:ribosomal protein S18 acetylase RimI-like enzyme